MRSPESPKYEKSGRQHDGGAEVTGLAAVERYPHAHRATGTVDGHLAVWVLGDADTDRERTLLQRLSHSMGVFPRQRTLPPHGRPLAWRLPAASTRSTRRIRALAESRQGCVRGRGHSLGHYAPVAAVLSVDRVFRFPRLAVASRWRARGVMLGHLCRQMHGDQYLLGDGFALDEGDQAERSPAFGAHDADPEHTAEKL